MSITKVTSVEASLRLDAIASAGLGISRTKMLKLIAEGMVRIDNTPAKSASSSVRVSNLYWYVNELIFPHSLNKLLTSIVEQEGQLISVDGLGFVRITEIVTTSKGKFKITCKRLKNRAASTWSYLLHNIILTIVNLYLNKLKEVVCIVNINRILIFNWRQNELHCKCTYTKHNNNISELQTDIIIFHYPYSPCLSSSLLIIIGFVIESGSQTFLRGKLDFKV
jgi:hypothetical protein